MIVDVWWVNRRKRRGGYLICEVVQWNAGGGGDVLMSYIVWRGGMAHLLPKVSAAGSWNKLGQLLTMYKKYVR